MSKIIGGEQRASRGVRSSRSVTTRFSWRDHGSRSGTAIRERVRVAERPLSGAAGLSAGRLIRRPSS